jgi:hypothetical protein
MYYSSIADAQVMRRAARGPAAIAARQRMFATKGMGNIDYRRMPIPEKQFEDWRLGAINPLQNWRFGAVNQGLVSAGGAAGGAIAGATAGSVIPVVGTAIGMVVGAVIGILTKTNNTASHIGSWDAQLAQGIQSLPASAAGIGRQIPWNENSHGLGQMIEALLATGVYMAWDTSLKSNYDVCTHWATCFQNAVQALTQAIVANPPGPCSVTVVLSTAAKGIPNKTFNFQNPGIQVGPDQIAAQIIMGASGLMYFMIISCGETAAHASSNANNALAQKVYALMVDNVAAQLVPAVPATPVPVIAPIVTAAATAANTAGPAAAIPAAQATIIPAATTQAPPTATVANTPNYGAGSPAPLISAPAVGYPTAPVAVPVAAAGIGTGLPSWAILAIAAVGLGMIFFKQGPVTSPPKV